MKTSLLSLIVRYGVLPLCKRPRIVSRLKAKGILLTFDDGPCEGLTKEILGILREFRYRALFFHVGKRIEEMPDLTRRCLDEGHEVGNHGLAMEDPLLQTYAEFIADYSQARNSLSRLLNLGGSEIYYRPPRGRINLRLFSYYWYVNAKVVLWSKQLDEFGPLAVSERISRSFSQLPLKEGDILLLHESSETVKALPSILGDVQKSKLEVLSARDAMAD